MSLASIARSSPALFYNTKQIKMHIYFSHNIINIEQIFANKTNIEHQVKY